MLEENRRKVELNRYNLEVFHSIAGLYRQNLDFLESLEPHRHAALRRRTKPRATGRAQQALSAVDQALDEAREIRKQRNTGAPIG